MINAKRLFLFLLPIAVSMGVAHPSSPATNSGYLIDHGVAIYYAIVPAEMIKGHTKHRPEATMHGGVPNRPHFHHLMVALFRVSSFERIVDAEVIATIGEIGLAIKRKMARTVHRRGRAHIW